MPPKSITKKPLSVPAPTNSRLIQSRERKRDQKEFIGAIEKAAEEVVESEQEKFLQTKSDHQIPSPPTQQKSVSAPSPRQKRLGVVSKTPNSRQNPPQKETENTNNNNNNNINNNNTSTVDGVVNEVVVTIPPLPESMTKPSTPGGRVKTSDGQSTAKKSRVANKKAGFLQPTGQSKKRKKKQAEKQAAKELAKAEKKRAIDAERQQQQGGNEQFKETVVESESGSSSSDDNETSSSSDDDDLENDPSQFVTISIPSPWTKGWISKRVRTSTSARSMNVYATDDFHKAEKSAQQLTMKYAQLMSAGQHNTVTTNTTTNTKNNKLHNRCRAIDSESRKDRLNASLEFDDEDPMQKRDLMGESLIGTDRDDPDRGQATFGRRLKAPLLIIRRFDQLDDSNNSTLLDINMDGNAKCISARRPNPNVFPLLLAAPTTTTTTISSSARIASLARGGERSPASSLSGNNQKQQGNNNNNVSSAANTEQIRRRELLMQGLNPYFGAGKASNSAMMNTGAEYELTQLELSKDPFAVRRRKRLERLYEQQNGGRGGMMSSSLNTGITQQSAFDTMDVRQAKLHCELSDLINGAREKTMTRNYLVPTAHAVCAEENAKVAAKNNQMVPDP